MLTLHLIRHGQTYFNSEKRAQGHLDSELTDLGRSQAETIRPIINAIDINAAYSSSSIRARQTADILMQGRGVDIEPRDELRELMMGPWQNELWADIESQYPEQHKLYKTQPQLFNLQGAESFTQMQKRGVDCIETIISEHASGHVLIVSHGAFLRTILSHYLGWDLGQNYSDIVIKNCSHSIIEVEGESRKVIQTGQTY